jgi:hypothetical protein
MQLAAKTSSRRSQTNGRRSEPKGSLRLSVHSGSNYCGGAVVAGAVDAGGGVVAAPPGVTVPLLGVELFVVEALPFLRVRVRVVLVPFGEFVVLVLSVVLVPVLFPFFRRREVVEFVVVLLLVVVLGAGLAVVGAVGSVGLPEAVAPAGEFVLPLLVPGAEVDVPGPGADPGGAVGVFCAIAAPAKVAQVASVISRIAFIGLLFINASSRESSRQTSDGAAGKLVGRIFRCTLMSSNIRRPHQQRQIPSGFAPLGIPLAFGENP